MLAISTVNIDFLDKRLSFDFQYYSCYFSEQIAPVSNDAGSAGNIISLALDLEPDIGNDT